MVQKLCFFLLSRDKRNKKKNQRPLHTRKPASLLFIAHTRFYEHIFCEKMKSAVFINISVLSKLF